MLSQEQSTSSVVRVKVVSAQAFKLDNTRRSSYKTRVRLRGLLQEDTHPSAEIVKMKSEQRKMSVSGEGRGFLFFPSGSLTAGSYEVAPTYLTSPRCARTSSATHAFSLSRVHMCTSTVLHADEPIFLEHLHKLQYTDHVSQRYSERQTPPSVCASF